MWPSICLNYLIFLQPEAILKNTRSAAADAPTLLAIADALDIEEDIWSPSYGRRGKLDVTVFAHTAATNTPSARAQPSSSSRSHFFSNLQSSASKIELLKPCPTPFEIKAGRANAGMERGAQTMLRALLAEERYASNAPAGASRD